MDTATFTQNIQKAQEREALVGCALARYYNSSINFNESDDPDILKRYDYLLYNINKGWSFRMEQQDDWYQTDPDGTLFFEQFTFANRKTIPGKLLYTKSHKFVYVLNHLEMVLILDIERIRNLVATYESAGVLQTTLPRDFDSWKEKHDTNPTQGVLLPIQDVLLNDHQAKQFTYDDLNINKNRYHELRQQARRNSNT